jgi:hypothetical protein
VPLLGLGTEVQEESPRRNVDALGVPDAAKRATGAVPLARAEAFNDVTAAPEPLNVVAVIVAPVKLPEASRATMVEAPLEDDAVVLALAKVPVEILEAFSVDTLAPLPFKVPIKFVADTLAAVKLPEASRATIVLAPLEAEAVV